MIYIPFEEYTGVGGPQTFMQNLKGYLDQNSIPYERKFKKAQNVFFPISFPIASLKKIKSKGGKIIQRLDGIYYHSKHGDEYEKLNKKVKDIYFNYSDYIVFQSEYSKKQCFSILGEIEPEDYEVIINGVNKDIFYPDRSNRTLGDKISFVTTSHFRNIDMIEPLVKALDIVRGNLDFELKVIGPIVNKKLKKLFDRDYIVHLGKKKREDIAQIYRNCHIFLYSHLNPPCPNAVLEAISSGLPVVSFNSGSLSELLFFSKDLLAPVSNEIFQKYEDFDPEKLAVKIIKACSEFNYYKELALEHSDLYSFQDCAKKYVTVFNWAVSKQPMPAERIYDRRYSGDYREVLSGYEIARWNALKHLLSKVVKIKQADRILDYGAGSGLHMDLWKLMFTNSELFFADISRVALEKIVDKSPRLKRNVKQIVNDTVDFPNDYFDLIISVEVMEHVASLENYLHEISRLLKPGGWFIWTTPCANHFSIEHIYNFFTKNIETTQDGFRRWTWEDPTHLRRLQSKEIKRKLIEVGFGETGFKFRAHFFSFFCSKLLDREIISESFAAKLMQLDYLLFRNWSNGASMIGYAKKK